MTTDSPATFEYLAIAAYDLFMWPGNFLWSRLPQYAPWMTPELEVAGANAGILPPAIVSVIAWSLFLYLAWKLITAICSSMFYGARRITALLTSNLQARSRRRFLSQPVEVPEVEFDDLDIAVLDLGSTIPPGFALTAAELSGQLTRRPAQVQQSLEKLRRYGLVDNVIGSTDGFDNYRLTRSGATILSMWKRQGVLSPPLKERRPLH